MNTVNETLRVFSVLLLTFVAWCAAPGETGAAGWLRYARITDPAVLQRYDILPSRIVVLGDTAIDRSAGTELQRGLCSMLGRNFTLAWGVRHLTDKSNAIVIGNVTISGRNSVAPLLDEPLQPEAFTFATRVEGHTHRFMIFGHDSRGELYGVFHLLELVGTHQPLPTSLSDSPSSPIRWVDQWDNFDGTIERGYAGRSIFFDKGHVRSDLTRVFLYGRLLSSIGLNGVTVNNVNSDLRTLEPDMIVEFARIADRLRPWGVKLSLSIDLSSPMVVGHLNTFDPLDSRVAAWWQSKANEIYQAIPDFGGFVVKADSEGRVGPSKYGRTPAEAANTVARALRPHGGVVLYRGFVYNNHLNWNDLKADRARAGYDNFHALDGKFDSNVVIQIKNGPIDFQVREPVSPLFSALRHTSQVIELQITQEYTGQQRHMVFLVPMWKTALDTDLHAQNRSTPLKEIVEGKSFHQPLGGFVGVANVGLDTNWLHHPMAMANLYGFGKLAWNPDRTTQQIIDSWTRLTWGNNPEVISVIDNLQTSSWRAYEQYTGNLGIGTLTNIVGYHYGPGIESAERNGWGQWFRGDSKGIGMDRTVATGTGYIGQYPPELAKIYENLATCPDDLLLFMHHVPYTYMLHDGKTVVQHVYDAHYEGAATAKTYAPRWETLHRFIDEDRYQQVLKLFIYQAGHAVVWRDAITKWFQHISAIPDQHGRVGNYPNRIEAENMTVTGYTPIDVHPWETASNSKAVTCEQTTPCSLTTVLDRPIGDYSITVQYFDYWSGKSHFELRVNGQLRGQWLADDILPPAAPDPHPDGETSTRVTFSNIRVKPGDVLSLRGISDGTEPAPVDYIEITPSANLSKP